jgi:hypothetical protein
MLAPSGKGSGSKKLSLTLGKGQTTPFHITQEISAMRAVLEELHPLE